MYRFASVILERAQCLDMPWSLENLPIVAPQIPQSGLSNSISVCMEALFPRRPGRPGFGSCFLNLFFATVAIFTSQGAPPTRTRGTVFGQSPKTKSTQACFVHVSPPWWPPIYSSASLPLLRTQSRCCQWLKHVMDLAVNIGGGQLLHGSTFSPTARHGFQSNPEGFGLPMVVRRVADGSLLPCGLRERRPVYFFPAPRG